MKLRVYLDTSVVSAYFDERLPERQAVTRDFWDQAHAFDVSTSDLARDELERTQDAALRGRFGHLLDGLAIISVTDEMKQVARHYVEAGVFTPRMWNDALHVACAVITRQDVLLSWNFRHLVNRRRRAAINDLGVAFGLPSIEILAPPEL